jgi:tripartite-type tricarboxylate transporter receptor subunit TctC
MVVPFAAGGPNDTAARILVEPVRSGQPVVIENVTGANGNIGVGRVAAKVPLPASCRDYSRAQTRNRRPSP